MPWNKDFLGEIPAQHKTLVALMFFSRSGCVVVVEWWSIGSSRLETFLECFLSVLRFLSICFYLTPDCSSSSWTNLWLQIRWMRALNHLSSLRVETLETLRMVGTTL